MPKMAGGQCVQPGQKSFGHLEISADYGRHQTESLSSGYDGHGGQERKWEVIKIIFLVKNDGKCTTCIQSSKLKKMLCISRSPHCTFYHSARVGK